MNIVNKQVCRTFFSSIHNVVAPVMLPIHIFLIYKDMKT